MPHTVYVPVEPPKRLSLAELAAHDDVCSEVMIDNAYFKSRIRKNRAKHIPVRGIKDDQVPKILLHKLIVEKNFPATEKALLKLPGLKRYRSTLRSKIEQEHFLEHIRKYIAIYETDCAWEVSTTNRYTITTYEAAVMARRRIKQGETIKYLVGTLVPLTNQESLDLDLTNRNFSIVVSSRKKNSSIFLGPARFANHDCDANGRLVMKGTEAMEVVAMKNIDIGDEITVSYGNDYFGPRNMDCLCHTCEKLERNGWTSIDMFTNSISGFSTPTAGGDSMSNESRRKRKFESGRLSSTIRPPPLKKPKTIISPSKLAQSWSPPPTDGSEQSKSEVVGIDQDSSIPSTEAIRDPDLALSPPPSSHEQQERAESVFSTIELSFSPPPQSKKDATFQSLKKSSSVPASSTKSRRPAKPIKRASKSDENIHEAQALPLSPLSNPSDVQPDTCPPEERELRSGETSGAVIIKVEALEVSKVEMDQHNADTSKYEQSTTPIAQDVEDIIDKEQSVATSKVENEAPAAISTITTAQVSTIKTDVVSGVIPSIEPQMTTTSSTMKVQIQNLSDLIRIPGDYILTRKLLAQPHDRWVQCHNSQCYGFFIQPNGYQTRRECPRCERHSMLYGFPWPKTDPDPRKLLERTKQATSKGKKVEVNSKFSAFRRQGRCGKGTWVEGGGDEEERVLDHRIIHRFVLPEEERELTRKGLLDAAEKARAKGEEALALIERQRSRARGTESAIRDMSDQGSLTPDDFRRRSNRFVTRVGVYTEFPL